ncbi:helix-turn-helix transcriptional regulator [Microbacterium suaedae]|uniref:helix-turn-helix transcriptional regulator n=1 Tax=Microbacterium suaedae TaxID=2067813 RepID=UPI000DA1DA7D|nr:LuxR family transcriptional regulator [Microbacterium suaedae]
MTSRSAPLAPRGDWPLVARDRLREPAVSALAAGRGVLVMGDPGTGKSTLTEGVVDDGVRGSTVWLRTPTTLSSPWSVLEPLIGRIDETVASGDMLTRLVRRCQTALEGLSDPVLVLDDAHLIGDATAIVLSEVVQLGAARLVCNARRLPRSPEPLFTLVRQGWLEYVEVGGLEAEQVHRLLSRVLDGPVALETAHRAHELTQGNPLYLRELVRSLKSSGALVYVDGAWVWNDQHHIGRRLTDLIGAELETLDPPQRDIVDLLALAGPVRVEMLEAVVDAEALEAVTALGLVVHGRRAHDRVTQVRLVHPVHTEVLRENLSPRRRRALYDWFQPDASTFASVDWALTCGVIADVDDLVAATLEAAAVQDHRLVIRISDVALSVLPDADPRALELLLVRAQIARYQGDAQATEQNLSRAAPLIPGGPDGDRARLRHARIAADLRQFGDDDVDGARRVMRDTPLSTPSLIALREADGLVRLAYAGRFSECLDLLEECGESTADPAVRAMLLGSRILGSAQAGRLDHALALADESLARWRLDPERYPQPLYELVAARTLAALWAGDAETASSTLALVDELHVDVDDAVRQTGVGRTLIARGEWRAAIAQLRGALSHFSIRDARGFGATAWSALAYALAAVGELDEARDARRQHLRAQSRASRLITSDSEMKLLAVALALGEDTVIDQCDDVDMRSAREGLWLPVLHARHIRCVAEAADSGAASDGSVGRLVDAAQRVDGPIPELMVRHARALAAGDGAMASGLVASLLAHGVWIPEPAAVELTPRQSEIATLVRAGLSNKAIAARLVISVRTVDAHLRDIFARLGVANRAELSAAWSRTGRE